MTDAERMERARWIVAVAWQHKAAGQIALLRAASAGQVVTLATFAQHELHEAWRAMTTGRDHHERMRAFRIVDRAIADFRQRAAREHAVARTEAVRLGVVAVLARVPEFAP